MKILISKYFLLLCCGGSQEHITEGLGVVTVILTPPFCPAQAPVATHLIPAVVMVPAVVPALLVSSLRSVTFMFSVESVV